MTKKPKETIGGKEICGAIFCLLAELICITQKLQENLVKLCYTAQKFQLSASILILIYVLIINQGGGID